MQRLKLAQLECDEDLFILQENDLEFIKGGCMMTTTFPSQPSFDNSFSGAGMNLLEMEEGLPGTNGAPALQLYKNGGQWVIGYGHDCTDAEVAQFKNGITVGQADTLLNNDVQTAESAVNGIVDVATTQSEYDALVDFTFNVGGAGFASSQVYSDLEAGAPPENVATDFFNWEKGQQPGTNNRRSNEYDEYLNNPLPGYNEGC